MTSRFPRKLIASGEMKSTKLFTYELNCRKEGQIMTNNSAHQRAIQQQRQRQEQQRRQQRQRQRQQQEQQQRQLQDARRRAGAAAGRKKKKEKSTDIEGLLARIKRTRSSESPNKTSPPLRRRKRRLATRKDRQPRSLSRRRGRVKTGIKVYPIAPVSRPKRELLSDEQHDLPTRFTYNKHTNGGKT
jgi:transcription initiation factor TFIID subunit TAF12